MSFDNIIQGFTLLQKGFEERNQRELELEKQMRDQDFKASDREDTQEFTAGENKANRATEIQGRHISAAPAHEANAFERDRARKLDEANYAAAQPLKASLGALGPEGQAAVIGLEKGGLSLPQTLNAIGGTVFEKLGKLGEAAILMKEKDPVQAAKLMQVYSELTDQALYMKEQEAQIEAATKYLYDPEKNVHYNIDPQPYATSAKAVYDKVLKDKKIYGGIGGIGDGVWDYDPSSEKDPSFFSWLGKLPGNVDKTEIQSSIEDGLKAMLKEGDSRMAGNDAAAGLAAKKMYQRIGLQGFNGFMSPTKQIDSDGKVTTTFTPNYIETSLNKNEFFKMPNRLGTGVEETPAPSIKEPSWFNREDDTSRIIRKKKEANSKTPVADTATKR